MSEDAMTKSAELSYAMRTGALGRRLRLGWYYLIANPNLLIGMVLLLVLVAFSLGGQIFWDTRLAYPLSAPVAQPPMPGHPFGTDTAGRDLLAVMILGTVLTMKVGLIAGAIGVAIGTLLAFAAGFYGGWVDRIVRTVVDIVLTVPGLLVLIILASTLQGIISSTSMALVIAALAWREPTRQIRSQVLVMREAEYVKMARMSGSRGWQIILFDMIPNLLPYLGATLVAAVAGAVLASVGLEALGLGPRQEPTLGMTVYWMMTESAFVRGLWWWIIEPLIVLIILFVGMYLVSIGLDEFANPRLRKRT
ncbi:MAG TPA: ABC transporter permease [Devosiaceae bacterium]